MATTAEHTAAIRTYTLQIPETDRSFFNSLVKKMGWISKRISPAKTIPAETIAAIKEARSGKDAGKVDTSSLETFINSME